VNDQYRLHRLGRGDEWALGTLAKGNARFSTSGDGDWVPPLSSEDAAEFADPRTVAMVAIESASNHLAGFVYGTVMYRRHTKLRHLCVYEIGVDTDHREHGVGMLLLERIGAEARGMGIDQGFAFASASDRPMRAIYDNAGGQTSGSEVLYGFRF